MNKNYEIPLDTDSNVICNKCGLIKSINCYIKYNDSLFKFNIHCLNCNNTVSSKNVLHDLKKILLIDNK